MIGMLDEQWQLAYSYGGHLQSFDEGIGDYVAMTGPALAPSGYLKAFSNFVIHTPHEFQLVAERGCDSAPGCRACARTAARISLWEWISAI